MHYFADAGYTICVPEQNNFRKASAVMNEMKKNSNIKCTVSQCRNNMVTEDYCCLDCIHVGTHESDPTVPECVDCNSFVRRTDGIMD